MNKTVEYMEEHLSEDLNLDILCGLEYMSRSHFVRQFTKRKGVSPMRFLRRLRIERAAGMLRQHPRMSVLAVAAAVGYHSITSFGDQFRQQMGMNPSEYRSQR